MSRYIDADKLHDDLTKIRINLMQEGVDITPIWQALDCVRQQPTADVRENITARKVIGGGEHKGATCWFECSRCGKTVDVNDKYCSECGARFEE